MVDEILKIILEMKFEQNYEIKLKILKYIVNKKLLLYKNDWQTICKKGTKHLQLSFF